MTKRLVSEIDGRTISRVDASRILSLVAEEKTDRQIATALGIHHKTVATYRRAAGLKPNGKARRYLELVDEKHAKCTRCHEIKPLLGWPQTTDGKKTKYLLSYCQQCRSKQNLAAVNKSIESNVRERWRRLRTRAGKSGILFSISFDDFLAQWKAQGGRCFYTDEIMEMDYGKGQSPIACSVDKVEPSEGYRDGNVVFSCNRINSIKANISLAEMKAWMPGWHARVLMWRDAGIPCAQVAEGDF